MKSNFSLVTCLLALFVCSVYCEDDLKIEDVHVVDDCWRKSAAGDMLSVHYTGTLTDGTKFESSRDRNIPFDFVLGEGQVMPGWDQGLVGMCPGSKRKLTIPPHLGYRNGEANKSIPRGSTLLFDVELLEIKDATKQENIFKVIDTNEDNHLSSEELANLFDKQASGMSNPFDSQSVVLKMMEHRDTDKDGRISFDEFTSKHDEL